MFDRRLAATGAALVITIMAAVVIASFPQQTEILRSQETISDLEKPEEAEDTTRQAQEDSLYIVKEHQGRVGIFSPDREEPVMVLERMVKYLPEYDREQLRQGIPVYSIAQLEALIEDYSS